MREELLQDSMVNIKWTDIQNFVDKQAVVLLPAGVIEEHGPQLCLGTDIYTAMLHCSYVKKKLKEKGIEAVIAPPFYWGVCQSTGSFIGSFRIRKETASALVYDILASLATFGFRNIFGVNAHGDIEQNIALIDAFREANTKLSINSRYLFHEHLLPHYGLSGDEPFLCPLKPQTIKVSSSAYPDVHAGDIETATIHAFYPELADVELAKTLPPVAVGDDKIMTWLFGGHTKELSEQGYLGSPADYEYVDVEKNLDDTAARITEAIMNTLHTDI